MASFKELKRRSILPFAGVALVLYYCLLFLPLSKHAQSFDEPLQKAWQKLACSLDQTNATSLDFQRITNQLNETRQSLALMEGAKKNAAARLELPVELRSKMSAQFQLVDYQNERSKQMDELEKKAKQAQVTLDFEVFAGFPEHTADLKEPSLLWPALALTRDVLETALRCKVSAIHSIEVALPLTNSPAFEMAGRWAEIPVQIELTSSGENALKLLQSLPLRAQEIKAAGLPEAEPQKAPLFLDRLIIRKQSPEKVDEVRVWLRTIGFVLHD
jgi:hypothetical protein